jgi:outer membrane protein OmpA-like peptidoglycan-associated protein
MGVNFSSKPYGTDSKTAIIEKTHILDSKNKIFSAMYNWEEVCGTYYAEGGEKFITIGNFTSNENTKSEKNKKDPKVKAAQITAAYYYIDDVSVVLVAEDGTCDCGGSSSGEESYSNTVFQKVINVNDGMAVKDQIELQNEYFGFGKSKLLPNSMKSLDLIAEDLKANPDLKLEIIGHNDEMEEKFAAEKPAFADMSNKRINEVIKYLTSKGIAESRLISNPVGISEPSPEISDIDEEDLKLAKNRRVSFKVR